MAHPDANVQQPSPDADPDASPDTAGARGIDLMDLDEARKLITTLAALVTAAAPEIGNQHARSLPLAFREASPFPDAPGEGPGETWTGPVS